MKYRKCGIFGAIRRVHAIGSAGLSGIVPMSNGTQDASSGATLYSDPSPMSWETSTPFRISELPAPGARETATFAPDGQWFV